MNTKGAGKRTGKGLLKLLLLIVAFLFIGWLAFAGQPPTLENRIAVLEREMEMCCSTVVAPALEAETDLEVMVRFRKKVNELERRIEELEAKLQICCPNPGPER